MILENKNNSLSYNDISYRDKLIDEALLTVTTLLMGQKRKCYRL